jgi:hypothetical protein
MIKCHDGVGKAGMGVSKVHHCSFVPQPYLHSPPATSFSAIHCRTRASAFSVRHSQRRTYVRRLKESKAAGSPEFPINLWFVNLLRSVFGLNTVQTGEVVKGDENDFLHGRGVFGGDPEE